MPFVTNRHNNHTRITAWPHSSLPKRGFVLFIGATWAMLMIPMLALLGTVALWGLLPFLLLSLGSAWYFLQRSYKDRQILETLTLDHAQAQITRQNPRGGDQSWRANVHWVVLSILPKGGPVDNYLTLTGNGRCVEFGAFLTPDERIALSQELETLLIQFKSAPGRG